METLIKRNHVEVTRSDRNCISIGYSDSGAAMHELANELVRSKDALIEAWADAFYRSSVGFFTKSDAREKAAAKYAAEIIGS